MVGNPLPIDDALVDGVPPAKSAVRAALKADYPHVLADADALLAVDASAASIVLVGGVVFKKNTALNSFADDGSTIIKDANGIAFQKVAVIGGITINAAGTFSGRDAFDDEDEGFTYISTDGDGGSITTAVLFVMGDGGSADWSVAIPFQGPIGPVDTAANVAGAKALALLDGEEGIAVDFVARSLAINDYANTKSNMGRPEDILTVSRASTAYRVNRNQLLESVGNNVLRYDHDPLTGVPLGALIEGARTNLFQRSEEFDNAYWSKTRASITANAAVAPDGTTTADKLVEDSTPASDHTCLTSTPSVSPSTTYTQSIWAKAAGRNWIRLRLGTNSGFMGDVYFDLQNGVLGSLSANVLAANIQVFPDGWYRCWMSAATQAGASTLSLTGVYLAEGDQDVTFDGDGTSGVYIWGAQVEAGGFPSSYIPTTSASATRSSDVVTKPTSEVPMPSQLRLTLFAEFRTAQLVPVGAPSNELFAYMAALGTNSLADSIISLRYTQSVAVLTGNDAAFDGSINLGAFALNTNHKAACTIGPSNDLAGCLNGGTVGTDTSLTEPTLDELTTLRFGNQPGGVRQLFGHLVSLMLLSRRVTDAELQAMTA